MYGTVIWATDGSDVADAALEEALQLMHPGGKLFAVHVDQRMVGGRASGLSYLPDEDERVTKIRDRVGELQVSGPRSRGRDLRHPRDDRESDRGDRDGR